MVPGESACGTFLQHSLFFSSPLHFSLFLLKENVFLTQEWGSPRIYNFLASLLTSKLFARTYSV